MNFSATLSKELHIEQCDGGCVNISNRIYLSLSENQERRRPVIDEQIQSAIKKSFQRQIASRFPSKCLLREAYFNGAQERKQKQYSLFPEIER